MLALDNFLGNSPLVGAIWGWPQRGGQVIDDRIMNGEVGLRQL